MPVTLTSNIVCPHCGTRVEPEVPFIASFIVVNILKRAEYEGAEFTCGNCHQIFYHKGSAMKWNDVAKETKSIITKAKMWLKEKLRKK